MDSPSVVLSKEHMAEIDRVTNYALKMADVINRGKNGEEMKYVWKIDTQLFPQAENNCLPISILLASLIERGTILGEKQFSSDKTLQFINSNTVRKKTRAYNALKNEFEKLKKIFPQLNKSGGFKFSEVCPILAKYYNVNIIIHKIQYGRDTECHIESGHGRSYNMELPRIDLLFEQDQQGIGHCAAIKPSNSSFKQKYGWHCPLCLKTTISHSHRHRCRKPGIQNCSNCNRILMNKTIRYKVYKSTRGTFTKYVYTVAIFFY